MSHAGLWEWGYATTGVINKGEEQCKHTAALLTIVFDIALIIVYWRHCTVQIQCNSDPLQKEVPHWA